jgi:hypothetical protein
MGSDTSSHSTTDVLSGGVSDGERSPGTWAVIALATLAIGFFFREYTSPQGPGSSLYLRAIGDLRFVDLGLGLVVLFFYAGVVVFRPMKPRSDSKRLAVPLLTFGVAIALQVSLALWRGGGEVFFAWRGLAYAAVLYPMFVFALGDPHHARWIRNVLFLVVGVRGVVILVEYALGGGVVLNSIGRIAYWDGYTLDFFVLVFAIALSALLAGERQPLIWGVVGISVLVIVLAFRRTPWAEIVLVVAVLALTRAKLERRRAIAAIITLAVLAVGVAVVFPVAAGPYQERVLTMVNVSDSGSRFSQTNSSHLEDVYDGLYAVFESPVMGQGLLGDIVVNRPGATRRSVQLLHNALLNTWVRFGMLGVCGLLAMNCAIARMYMRLVGGSGAIASVGRGAGAFLLAQAVVTSAFAPPAFAGFQGAVTLAFCLGALSLASVDSPMDSAA